MFKSIPAKLSIYDNFLSILWGLIGVLPIILVYPTSQSQIGLRDIGYYVYAFNSENNWGWGIGFFTIFGTIGQFLRIETAADYLAFIYFLRIISVFLIFIILSKFISEILSNESLALRLSVLLFAILGQYQAYIMFLYRIRFTVGLAIYLIGLYLFSSCFNREHKLIKLISRIIIACIAFIISALIHELSFIFAVFTILILLFNLYAHLKNYDFYVKIEIIYLFSLIVLPIFLIYISYIEINGYYFYFYTRRYFSFIYLVTLSILLITYIIVYKLKKSRITILLKTHLSKNIFYIGIPSLLLCTFLLKIPINANKPILLFLLTGLWLLFLIDTIDEKKLSSITKVNLILIYILIIIIHSSSIMMQFWEFGANIKLGKPSIKPHNQLNAIGNLLIPVLVSYWVFLSKNNTLRNKYSKGSSAEKSGSLTYYKEVFKDKYLRITLIILLIFSSIGSFRFVIFQGNGFLDDDVTLNREILDNIAFTGSQILENEKRNNRLWDILIVNGDPLRNRMMGLTGYWVQYPEESANIINSDNSFNNFLKNIEKRNLRVWVFYVIDLPFFIKFDLDKLIENSELIFTVHENALLLKLA